MRLLDADILIDIGRGHPPATQWYNGLTGAVGVPGIVVMELIAGCNNKADVARVHTQIAPFPVVWPTEPDCQRALGYFTQYRLSHNLGLLDSLIAATALCLGATLCTFNVKHFAPSSGLVLEQPYTR